MNTETRDRLELLLDDASKALREARLLCRGALDGAPGEYERLGQVMLAHEKAIAARESLTAQHSVRV